jgi:hypothetical protein
MRGMHMNCKKSGALAALSFAAIILMLAASSTSVLAQDEEEWLGGYDPLANVMCCIIILVILVVIGVVIYMVFFKNKGKSKSAPAPIPAPPPPAHTHAPPRVMPPPAPPKPELKTTPPPPAPTPAAVPPPPKPKPEPPKSGVPPPPKSGAAVPPQELAPYGGGRASADSGTNVPSRQSGAVGATLPPHKSFTIPPPPDAPDGKIFKIDMGRNHLFLTEDVEMTFKTFKKILQDGHPGLCLTNRFPDNVRDDFNIKKDDAKIMWFSDSARGDNVLKPGRLDFEVAKSTIDFIKNTDEPVILIDGLDYLILTNGFEAVSTFLKKITDVASMARATLVVIVRPDALSSERVSYLKGQFDRVA